MTQAAGRRFSPAGRGAVPARPTAGATGDPLSRELVRKAPPGDHLSRVAVRKRPEGGYLLQRTRAQIGFAHALSGISLAYAALLGEGLKPAPFPPPTTRRGKFSVAVRAAGKRQYPRGSADKAVD